MRTTRSTALALAPRIVWLVAIALDISGVALAAAASPLAMPATPFGFVSYLGLALAILAYSNVGLIVSLRRPDHRIGWLFGAVGVLSAVTFVCVACAYYAASRPEIDGPIVGFANWLSRWLWAPTLALISVFLFLLFPDERLNDRRSRAVAAIGVIGAAVAATAVAFVPSPFLGLPGVNPFAVPALGPWLRAMAFCGLVLLGAATLTAVVLLLLRFRRSTGDERQQLKWFSVGAVLLAAGVVAGLLLADELASAVRPTAGAFVVEILSVTGLIALPVTTGIGILKYRLYHIDHLINRALVYAALTAILAGLYSASIRLFQALFIAFTGNQSDAALVLTTLVLATTFTPIKSRLETIAGTRLGQRDPHDTGRRTDERGAHGYDDSTLARELHTLADRVASVEAAIDGLMHERDRSGWTDTTRPRKKPREVRSEPARTGEPVRTIGSRHR